MGRQEQGRSILSNFIRNTLFLLTNIVHKTAVIPERAISWTWKYDSVNMSENGVAKFTGSKCLSNGTAVANGDMGIVCGTRKGRRLARANGIIHGTDCECAMSSTLTQTVTQAVTSSTLDGAAKSQAWRLWAYTPWRNGYHEFKQDVSSKCSRFVNTYVYWSSPENNNHLYQNKNKTVGAATSRTPTARTGKRPTLAEQHAEEIGRLEALCESRTKELNYAKMQLKQSAAGFEAMSVLVNHLTYGLDAFACPDVKRQLEETKERLENAQVQLAELMTQRDALIEEIKCMKDRQAREVERLREEHSTTLKTTEDRLTKQNEENTAKLKEEHSKEVSALKTSHEKSMEDMAQAHDTLIKKKEKEQEESLMKHKQQSQAHIEDLQHQHEHALSDITKRFENIKMTLSEKVDHLRAESEAMRRREREYLASYKADSDMKVQLAVQPFKHLPQEIESLKAVLEMRNQEIHELRRKNLEFEKQLEELPKAREKITHLEQKNENLEAVIKLKVDYERQLSEKHSVLLRRYDKEAKANKRLSMDKEELEWRLSQDSTGLAELLNRSISHSPPSSTASTPEATRRRKSPLPQQSPRSPRGGIAMEFFDNKSPRMSRSMLESPRSNGTNAHHRKQVKSADFDRPIFSTRHSSADLYTTRRDPNNVFEAEHSQDDSLMSVSTHSEPSKSNPSPVKTNLKRSGTYDLLNEEFELCEEGTCSNNLKQTDV